MSMAALRPCLGSENASIGCDIERNDDNGEWEQEESEININKIASWDTAFPRSFLLVRLQCGTQRE